MKADTKASDWRSRERTAGSVAVGAGVGVGEGVALGEAVGESDCALPPDWPDWPGSGAGDGLGEAVGCGPRGIRSGSTARVTPAVAARVSTAERSAWS